MADTDDLERQEVLCADINRVIVLCNSLHRTHESIASINRTSTETYARSLLNDIYDDLSRLLTINNCLTITGEV